MKHGRRARIARRGAKLPAVATPLLLALTLLDSAPAGATDVRGRFTTIATASEDPRTPEGVSSLPVLEIVSLELSDFSLPGVDRARIVARGWGRGQLGDDQLQDSSGDVELLYIDARSGPVALRLGRQHISYGLGRMAQIDGVEGRIHTCFGLVASGYFGATVNRELAYDRGDWQGGARLAWRFDGPAELGVAFSQARRSGEITREELGADGFWLVGPVRILGRAVGNVRWQRFVEARLGLGFDLPAGVALGLDIEHVEPDMLLPRDSLFSVISDVVHQSIGANLRWEPSAYYRLDADGRALLLDGDSLGYDTKVGARAYREPNHLSVVGLELRRLDEDDNGYVRGRALTGLQITPRWRVGADLFLYRYDEAVRGTRGAYLGQSSLVFDPNGSIRVAGTFGAGSSPQANSYVEGFVRFEYGWNTDLALEVGP